VKIPLAIDDRQHFPLARKQIDEGLRPIVERRQPRNDAGIRDAVRHSRPFVDAARTFHEQ
jgi:hypothetical protein